MSCESCNLTLSNTGSGCSPVIAEACQYIIVPTLKADGTKNFITVADALDAAYYVSQLNAVSDERWRPTLPLRLLTDERAENQTQDLGGGVVSVVADGIRTVVTTMTGKLANPQLLGKFESFQCGSVSAYPITRDGAIVGMEVGGDKTKLYPIKIEDETFAATFVKHSVNNTLVQGIQLNFTWGINEKDKNLRQIVESEMVDPVKGIKGIKDGLGEDLGNTLTTIDLQLTDCFGTLKTPGLITGLVVGDFSLEELSPAPAAIPLVSADEVTPGVYRLTFAAQTANDIMRPTVTKTGYDFTQVNAMSITLTP